MGYGVQRPSSVRWRYVLGIYSSSEKASTRKPKISVDPRIFAMLQEFSLVAVLSRRGCRKVLLEHCLNAKRLEDSNQASFEGVREPYLVGGRGAQWGYGFLASLGELRSKHKEGRAGECSVQAKSPGNTTRRSSSFQLAFERCSLVVQGH